MAELFFGVENSATRDQNRELLRQALAGLKCRPLSRPASEEFGLMTILKREGQTIGPIDVLVAAIALTLPNCVVVWKDGDLRRIPGLSVQNWREGETGTA